MSARLSRGEALEANSEDDMICKEDSNVNMYLYNRKGQSGRMLHNKASAMGETSSLGRCLGCSPCNIFKYFVHELASCR